MTSNLSPKPPSLKQRALRAGGWSFAGYGASQAIRLGSNLIMTRLLVPEMFGVMAIAGMVTIILTMLSDIGLRQHIVQSPRGDDAVFLDTAWSVQLMRGFGLWLVALLLALGLHIANGHGVVAAGTVYASPLLPLIIAVNSFQAVIIGCQSTTIATAHRSFNQKRLAQTELIAQIAGLGVMMAIGVATRSIWALVAGSLVSALTTTVLSHTWLSGHRNRFRWEKEALRELLDFGKWIFISSAVSVLAFNGDRLLLGGLVEARVLGLYSIAVLIVGAIQSANSRFASTVSLPTLSEIARTDPSRLREVYYKLRLPIDLLLLFMAGFLSSAGQLVIDLLYDSRYAETGAMLRILSLSFIAMRYDSAQQIYLAVGIPRNLTIINVVRCASLYGLVPLAFHLGGTYAAIWAVALHALVTLPWVFVFNARLGLNDFRRELLALLIFPAAYLCGYGLMQARAWWTG